MLERLDSEPFGDWTRPRLCWALAADDMYSVSVKKKLILSKIVYSLVEANVSENVSENAHSRSICSPATTLF